MKNIVTEKINMLNCKSIMSIDAETNGLWGKAFAIAAVVYDAAGQEVDRFVARCPIEEETNIWVAANVIPQMENIEETHKSFKAMLTDFFAFIKKHNDAIVLCHMGHIVEANLLKSAHDLQIIGDFEAPYLWYDVCLFFDDSTDTYCKENNIVIDDVEGGTHNPLYDCMSAYKAFKHFVQS